MFGWSLAELDQAGTLTDGVFVGVPSFDGNTGDSIPALGRVYIILGVSPGAPIAIDPILDFPETGDPARFGEALAHTPITTVESPLGRLIVSGQRVDVLDNSDEYVTSPRRATDLGRVFGFDFLNEPLFLP